MANPVQYQPDVAIDPNAVNNRIGRVTTPPLDNTGATVAALGGSLDNLGSALQTNANRVQALQDQDAEREAHVTAAKTAADVYQQFADAQDAQGDNPAGFTPKFMAQFDDYTKGIVDATPNLRAQQVLRANFAGLALHMSQKAMAWQAAQSVEYKGQQIEDSTREYAKVVGTDESVYAPVRDGVYNQIEQSGLPLKIRDNLREKADAALTNAAALGWTQRNPAAALQTLNRAIGTPGAPPPVVPAPPGWTPDMLRTAATEANAQGLTEFQATGNVGETEGAHTMIKVSDVLNPQPTPATKGEAVGLPFVDGLSTEKKISLQEHAATLVRQGQMGMRVGLERDVRNQEAQAKAGFEVSDIPEARFVAAYGDPATGHEKFLESQNWVAFGSGIRAMQAMPQNDMEQYLAAQAPADKNAPDFANQMARYNNLHAAADHLAKQRAETGLQALAQQGVVQLGPLDPGDAAGFQAELAHRQDVAAHVAGVYIPNPTPFTPGEAQAFGRMLNSAPVGQQLSLLASLRRGLSDDRTYRTALSQIRPDAPELAQAGALQAKQPEFNSYGTPDAIAPAVAAETILRGSAALHPSAANKKEDGIGHTPIMPDDKQIEQAFIDKVGDAFAGDFDGMKQALQSVRYYYAGAAIKDGAMVGQDKSPDSKRLEQAIDAVTGGVAKVNGHQVIKPYGMPDDVFAARFAAARDETLRAAGYNPEAGVSSGYYPINAGDGRYALATGLGFVPDQRGRTSMPLIVEVPTGGDVGPPRPGFLQRMRGVLTMPEPNLAPANTQPGIPQP